MSTLHILRVTLDILLASECADSRLLVDCLQLRASLNVFSDIGSFLNSKNHGDKK
jgi:hypothetical protein